MFDDLEKKVNQFEETGKIEVTTEKTGGKKSGNPKYQRGKNDTRNPFLNAPALPKPSLPIDEGEIISHLIPKLGEKEINPEMFPNLKLPS